VLEHHAMRIIWEDGSKVPTILNLDNKKIIKGRIIEYILVL